MTAFFGPRAGAESAFIIAVAVLAYLLELSFAGVVAAIFGAWVVVAVFEIFASRSEATATATRSDEEATEPGPVVADAEAPPPLLPAPERGAPPPPPLAPPAPAPTLRPEPALEEGGETGAPEEAEPVTVAMAPPPPPRAAPPPPAPLAPPVPPATTAAPTRVEPTGPRQWNLWELERAARERAGRDPVRDEERSFLLMYLREFADAEGNLPDEFDSLVRDSFGDLLAAGR